MMKTSSAELQEYNTVVDTSDTLNPSASIRNSIIYFLLLAGIAALINYFFINYVPSSVQYAGMMYAGAFFLIGLAHIFIFPKWLSHLWYQRVGYGTIYTIALIAIGGAGSLFLFPIANQQLQLMAIVAVAAFLLPYSIYTTVHYFRSIGSKEYEPWIIPPDVEPDTRMSLLLNSIHFKIKIHINQNDIAPTTFVITLPLKLKLSAVFIRFLYDKHDVIEMADSGGYPYGWLFSVKRGWRKKMLDPELTLRENGVKEDDVITVERTEQD